MKKMKKMVCAFLAIIMVAGVSVIPTEARSDNAKVKELQALIDEAEGQTNIYLQENLTWGDGEPIEIPAGKDIIINLNGYTLESLDIFPVFKVESGAQLRIVNWSREGGGYGDVKQAALYDGYEIYEEEWLGLFEVEESAKLVLQGGFYSAGYDMFTSVSAGEIDIIAGWFNKMPNGNYSLPEWERFALTPWVDNTNWYTLEEYVYMITGFRDYNAWRNIPVGQELSLSLSVNNFLENSLGHVEIQLGYATSDEAFAEDEFIPFEKAVAGEGYTVNGNKVVVEDFEGRSEVWATFSGTLPEELANKEILMVWKLDVVENGESVKNMTQRMSTTTYQVTSDTKDSITEEEVSKPVEDVTVVKKQETEQAVKDETAKVVATILGGRVSEEVVSAETATKVVNAINSGKSVQTEIIVKEMTAQEVEQITDSDKSAIEEKVAAELGEKADVQYLDLSIVLKAGNEELGTLNKLEEKITITVAIPEELKAENRAYKVIRNHEGVVEVLDTVVNEDGTISFKTDRFSTYALAYAEQEGTGSNTSTNANQGNNTPTTDTKAPQTGDNNTVIIYMVMCLSAVIAILAVKKRNIFVK